MSRQRCHWVNLDDELYIAYHDEEWGVPVHEDQKLFEFLVLESMQAGLSWRTVLHKRENFRHAFANFDPKLVARFDDQDIERLLNDAGIIRNKLKINAAINNARRFLEVVDEYGTFDKYIWQFTDGKSIINKWGSDDKIPASTKESDMMSKDLKDRGFKFVGTTICYAHMQATGMVNDHLATCFRYTELGG